MDLISKSALRVARVVWRPGHGGFAFTVVCKATFELRPDVSPLAAAQEPVIEADVHDRQGGAIALASELVPFKKWPEVLITGHAHAPKGRPVPSLLARLVVGEIDKAIQVVGDRHFGPDGRPGEPSLFGRMPLVWERAAGGPGTSNPAGIPPGGGGRTDLLGRTRAPNLLPAGLAPASRSDIVPPVGFGPIAPGWPARAACLQRLAAPWDPDRWHERPLSADLDLAYFNAAPPDQQRAQPFGEEAIHLEYLHPLFPRLSTRLAPVMPAATVDLGAGPQPLQLRCDTMVIDTDRGLAMLVWRAHAMLDQPDRPGRVVVTGPAEPEEASPARASGARDGPPTLGVDAFKLASAILPFSPAPAPAAASAPARAAALAPAPLVAERAAWPRAGDTVPSKLEQAGDTTLAPGLVAPAAPLPFGPPQGEGAPRREAPLAGSRAGLPFAPPEAREEQDEPPTARRGRAAGVEPAPEVVDLDLDAYPPGRCGAIAARLACDEGRAGDVLRAEGLDAARWKRVHDHWLERIRDEAARGRKKPLADYDAAYVGALEAKRGPIALGEYARLAEAAERGAAAGALAERGLPVGAWPHVHRVWIARMVNDARLVKQVRAGIDAARGAA